MSRGWISGYMNIKYTRHEIQQACKWKREAHLMVIYPSKQRNYYHQAVCYDVIFYQVPTLTVKHRVCVCVCVSERERVCVCVCVCVIESAFIYIYYIVYMCIYIYIYIYTHTHTHSKISCVCVCVCVYGWERESAYIHSFPNERVFFTYSFKFCTSFLTAAILIWSFFIFVFISLSFFFIFLLYFSISLLNSRRASSCRNSYFPLHFLSLYSTYFTCSKPDLYSTSALSHFLMYYHSPFLRCSIFSSSVAFFFILFSFTYWPLKVYRLSYYSKFFAHVWTYAEKATIL